MKYVTLAPFCAIVKWINSKACGENGEYVFLWQKLLQDRGGGGDLSLRRLGDGHNHDGDDEDDDAHDESDGDVDDDVDDDEDDGGGDEDSEDGGDGDGEDGGGDRHANGGDAPRGVRDGDDDDHVHRRDDRNLRLPVDLKLYYLFF